MQTVTVTLSDAAITRYSYDQNIRQLRDEKRNVVIRFHGNRQSASWYLVRYANGKTIWRKVGSWPAINSKSFFARLPELNAQMAVNTDPEKLRVGQMKSTGQVLAWYMQRVSSDKNLSNQRRLTVKSAIRKHLIPRVGLFALNKLDGNAIDQNLIWPLQGDYAPSYIRSIFSVLKSATRKANDIGIIESDPCASLKFTKFMPGEIKAKGGKLRPHQVPDLFKQLVKVEKNAQLLFLLMLMYGTRLNETRLVQRSHLSEADWLLPSQNTKNGKELLLPITDVAGQVLERFKYKGRYIFASRKNSPISRERASELIRDISEKEWSAHDLRKLARTQWQEQGADHWVGELMLNHTLSKLDKAYIHTHAKQLMHLEFDKYHNWLMENGLTEFLEKI